MRCLHLDSESSGKTSRPHSIADARGDQSRRFIGYYVVNPEKCQNATVAAALEWNGEVIDRQRRIYMGDQTNKRTFTLEKRIATFSFQNIVRGAIYLKV